MNVEEIASSLNHLKSYLTSHESDIACDINDFGELKGVFTLMMGRVPYE